MTPDELQGAVERILKAAGYDLEPDQYIHGAQFDLVATRRADAIPVRHYIEITTERVDVTKYGKDLTKLVLAREKDPGGHGIIISSSGFAGLTKERAEETRFHCWTFDEFRQKYVPTGAYEAVVLGPPASSAERKALDAPVGLVKPLWRELEELAEVYQEPDLLAQTRNGLGEARHPALTWFDSWLVSPARTWVSLVGDYGTGKTALTKVLLRRWMQRWQLEGGLLPIRIELRDFATKFDFEGLLIHFWKTNNLDDLPYRALELLVAEGKVVFLLDGYDEMAQNLNLMDRRNCLVALAKALSGASTGIITSRPNYFTEAEELNVVELLYRKGTNFHRLDRELILRESEVDSFLSQYYYERNDAKLLDLSPEQVESLIANRLRNEPEMLDNVRRILASIYKFSKQEYGQEPDEAALANKPVVITYLLEVAENLGDLQVAHYQPLDEWGIYQLIMDRLVRRDQRRTSGIVVPSERRLFLQRLALRVTINRRANITKQDMLAEVHALFGSQINRLGTLEVAAQEDIYFADLRSSASLTSERDSEDWMFSHNSLREFLVAELIVESVRKMPHLSTDERNRVLQALPTIPLTQGLMRFTLSSFNHFDDLRDHIAEQLLTFSEKLLPFFVPVLARKYPKATATQLETLIPQKRLVNVFLSELILRQDNFVNWFFEDVVFDRADFDGTHFKSTTFKNCVFYDCSISNGRFEGGIFENCEFSSVVLHHCMFAGTTFRSEIITSIHADGLSMSDDIARAYLRFRGGTIVPERPLNTYVFSPKWADFAKVLEQVTDNLGLHQELGLVKKGGITDTRWTQSLVNALVNGKYLERSRRGSRNFVRVLPAKMDELKNMLEGHVPSPISKLLSRN